jgi:PIN domain nuclease of toxin-antitoxin system
MDRMLIAQALNANLPVITEHGLYNQYGLTAVW